MHLGTHSENCWSGQGPWLGGNASTDWARACCLHELEPLLATACLTCQLCLLELNARVLWSHPPHPSIAFQFWLCSADWLSQNSNFEVEWGKSALKSIKPTPWWWFHAILPYILWTLPEQKADCPAAFSSLSYSAENHWVRGFLAHSTEVREGQGNEGPLETAGTSETERFV